jgi:Secretion system C-terminal sorting domain
MKKRNLWLLAAATVCFATAKLEAQPNNYYMSLGANCDHGRSNQVINALGGADFVSVGTGLTPFNNRPVATLSKHDALGNWIWSYEYQLDFATIGSIIAANGNSVAANPTTNEYVMVVYINKAIVGFPFNITESVAVRVNSTGNVLSKTGLGPREVKSIVYNQVSGHYAVLGQTVIGTDQEFELTLLNGTTGAYINSFSYGSGPGMPDTPARLCYSSSSGNYTMVGRSFNGSNSDVFVVHTTSSGAIINNFTYDFGNNETGVDVVDYNAGTEAAILGHDITNDNSFIFTIADLTGIITGPGSSVPPPPFLNTHTPLAITTDPTSNNIIICGKENSGFFGLGTNGFVAVVDPSFAPLNYCLYGQPAAQPGNEHFNDVMYDVGTSQLIFAGEHTRINSWPGATSPPNQEYPWLVMANPLGNGACSMPLAMGLPIPYLLSSTNYNVSGPTFQFPPIFSHLETTTTQVMLDECSNPFRVEGAGASQPATATVYPNPATTEITIENSSETDLVFELTNALGEQVMNKSIAGKTGKMLVDISGVNPGIYFYRIYNGATTITTEKLIITR